MSGGLTRVSAGHYPAERLVIDLLTFIYFRFGGSAGSKNMELGYSVSYGVGSGAQSWHIILSDGWVRPLRGLLPRSGDYGRNVI